MKKLFTLFASMLIALVASAQNEPLQFCFENGDVIESWGYPILIDRFDDELVEFNIYQMNSGIYVKNNTSSDITASISVDILNVDGQMSICLGPNCVPFQKVGYGEVKNVTLKANSLNNLDCHWSPLMKDGKPDYGRCDAQLSLYANGELCSTIEVTFRYYDDEDNPGSPQDGSFVRDDEIEGTVKWGYISDDDEMIPYGKLDMTEGRYDVAMFVPGNSALNGAKLCGVYVPCIRTCMGNMTVWASKELGGERIAESKYTGTEHRGYLTVPFDKEIQIPATGLYVGYSFDLSVDEIENQICLATCVGKIVNPNGLFWGKDNSFNNKGSLMVSAMQLFVKDVKQLDNAASIQSVVPVANEKGKKTSLTANIVSDGQGINALGYTLTIDGKATQGEYIFDMPVESGLNKSATFALDFELPNQVGTFDASLAINTVNGQPNEACTTPYLFNVSSVTRVVPRMTVLEEFTGTGCANCPRGFVALDNIKKQYADKVAIVSWHNYDLNDPMYVAEYAPLGLLMAPDCTFDRKEWVDPYMGDHEKLQGPLGILNETNAMLPTVAVDVKGAFADDSHKQIRVSANTELLVDAKDYTIAFAITADGLTGTTGGWLQKNEYCQMTAEEAPIQFHPWVADLPGLEKFCKGNEWGKEYVELVYDDVLIASSYDKSGNTLIPAFTKTKASEKEVSEYTINMPTNEALTAALDYSKIYVVAIVIDGNGKVANAARTRVLGADESAVSAPAASTAAGRIYNVAGQQVSNMDGHGIFIKNGKKIVK